MKKTVYIILTTFLGILLSFLVHSTIEITYLNWANKKGIILSAYSGITGMCFIHPVAQISLLLAGIILGLFLGFLWWDIVYVKKRHWRTKKS